MYFNWLRTRRQGTSKKTRGANRHAARQPQLEILEPRVLLSGRRVRDDFPSGRWPIALDADGSGTQYGVIERKRDSDAFRIVAPVSGQMTIDHAARPGSRLQSVLVAWDEPGTFGAVDYDGQMDINVTAGSTYIVVASGYRKSRGAYQLSFHTETSSGGGSEPGPQTLTLTGTEGDDVLTLGADGTGLRYLVVNGVLHDLETEYGHDTFVKFTRIQVDLFGGNDQITIDSSVTLPAVIEGGDGDDVLAGGSGNDTMRGGGGDDFLVGGPGSNSLSGGTGSDTWAIIGTENADTIQVLSTSKTGLVQTSGVIAQQDNFTDLEASIDQVLISGEGGDDGITVNGSISALLFGDEGNDTLQGGPGVDFIDGGTGNDQIRGMGGNDSLFGYSGDDTVDGGDGNDTLIGSGGTDLLRPGPGGNEIWTGGLSNSSAGSALASTGARAATGIQVSFQKTVTIGGSLAGFSGSATATVTVNGTLGFDGTVTGTLSAVGSARGSGLGCTASGTFTASGSVNGPLSAVAWSVSYAGSGSVDCANGYHTSGGVSGGYSGVISLISGVGRQSVTSGNGGVGFDGSGDLSVSEFTTNNASSKSFGNPVPPPAPVEGEPFDPTKDYCTLVPDVSPDGLDFSGACWQHDNGYSKGTNKSRLQVDLDFLENLRSEASLKGRPNSIWPWVYFIGVRTAGWHFYQGPAELNF